MLLNWKISFGCREKNVCVYEDNTRSIFDKRVCVWGGLKYSLVVFIHKIKEVFVKIYASFMIDNEMLLIFFPVIRF